MADPASRNMPGVAIAEALGKSGAEPDRVMREALALDRGGKLGLVPR
jgi:hypothetical protein